MKAIFLGSLAEGFSIHSVVADEAADDITAAFLANGQIAEAIEVGLPSSLDKNAQQDETGVDFVVYGTGLGNGFSVYGPFADSDEAEEFAENNRSDDDEWELFEAESGFEPVEKPAHPAPAA